MTWNYRVIKSVYDVVGQPDEVTYGIHEVYYDEDGKPTSCTAEPVSLYGETLEELQEEAARFVQACTLPVLTEDDFNNNCQKSQHLREESEV